MLMHWIDWSIVIGFSLLILLVGVLVSRKAGKSTSDFFLGGRTMPFWLLGISMVATTFSADTPNLLTDIVRTHGVAGNWVWWAFLLTGMLTVFVYAKLWRRSGVMTDVEFYELRYSGPEAAFLRGFRAIYLGVFFNIMVMATVSLAAIKIGGVLLNLSPIKSIAFAMLITVIYCSMGGLRSVLITDFILFSFAMAGAILAAVILCRMPEVGGLSGLLSHPQVNQNLSMIPAFTDSDSFWKTFVPVLLIPIAVQWWSVWYPGSEPGGGGYQVQRILSAKNEKHAIGATLLFNACHYGLRPWPWIIVALASMIIFPDLKSIQERFPHVPENIIRNDIAYPAMLTFLPTGVLGIVVASLIAAYMSTIASHLNWGASYVVNDFYRRFIKPAASEKELVMVGRISTVVLLLFSTLVALIAENALQMFDYLLLIGAGTGLIFIMRWFWWRINAWTEITGMVVSGIIGFYMVFVHHRLGFQPIESHWRLVIGVAITTACWLAVTLLTQPSQDAVLRHFFRLIRPGGPGWKPVIAKAAADNDPIVETAAHGDLPRGILCMVFGCLIVYSIVFSTGFFLYGQTLYGIIGSAVAVVSILLLTSVWGKLEMK